LSARRKAFYCSAKASFGKVDRIASEEVLLQLISKECIPIACPLVKSELASLDFVVNRFLWRCLELVIWMVWDSVNRALASACRVYCGRIV